MTCLNLGQLTRLYAVDDTAERWTLIVLYMKNTLNFLSIQKRTVQSLRTNYKHKCFKQTMFSFKYSFFFFNWHLLTFAFCRNNINPVQFQIIITLTHRRLKHIFVAFVDLKLKCLNYTFSSLTLTKSYSRYCLKLQFITVMIE